MRPERDEAGAETPTTTDRYVEDEDGGGMMLSEIKDKIRIDPAREAKVAALVEAGKALIADLRQRAENGKHHPSADIRAMFSGSNGETIIQCGNGVLFNLSAALQALEGEGK